MTLNRRNFAASAAALVAVGLSRSADAETYPSRVIKMVVPISTGSATDVIGRLVAESLRVSLGQPVIVENRPGAGGSIGAATVAKAPPDGYTLLTMSSAHTSNPALFSSLPYDTAREFNGITMLATLPLILVVAPARNIRSVAELVALAKAKPGELTYSSSGVGSALHMGTEQFRAMARFDATHVPYRGTPEAMADVIAGRVDFAFLSVGNALPAIRDGRLIALACSTDRRSHFLPDVPTTVQAGIAGSSYNPWVGLFAPAGTPSDVISILNNATVKALETQEITEKFAAIGAEPAPMSAAAFDDYVAKELTTMKELVRVAKIPVN